MTRFPIHTVATAPAASKPLLENSIKAWGFIPTLHGTLAEAPIAFDAYTAMYTAITTQGSLSAQEQQVAFQAVNVLHGCEYCTAGHTYLSRSVGMADDAIAALRNGEPIPGNSRFEALRVFTEAVVRERGMAGDNAVAAFLAAGFTQAQVLEVVTIVACKTLSNYTNHLTHTPLEGFMADPSLNWKAPGKRVLQAA